MSSSNGFGGVSECYAFKSRLQEYAQKVGFTTPVYHTVMEGPAHEPIFRSTVVVNNITYESLPGFHHRKTAEQSAAEVALMEMHKSGQMITCSPIVHKTGLCKNLLQEYAQKMNFAVPLYTFTKRSHDSFSCAVDVGGIRYIGAAARNKREAEINAARTALLAIHLSSSCRDGEANGVSTYTVLPGKRKRKDTGEMTKHIRPKETMLKKKGFKNKSNRRNRPRFKRNYNGEVCNAQGNDFGMLEAEKISASAVMNGSNSQNGGCGSGRREEHSGNELESCRGILLAPNADFQNGLARELDHVGQSEGCLNRLAKAENGYEDRLRLAHIPPDGKDSSGSAAFPGKDT